MSSTEPRYQTDVRVNDVVKLWARGRWIDDPRYYPTYVKGAKFKSIVRPDESDAWHSIVNEFADGRHYLAHYGIDDDHVLLLRVETRDVDETVSQLTTAYHMTGLAKSLKEHVPHIPGEAVMKMVSLSIAECVHEE